MSQLHNCHSKLSMAEAGVGGSSLLMKNAPVQKPKKATPDLTCWTTDLTIARETESATASYRYRKMLEFILRLSQHMSSASVHQI